MHSWQLQEAKARFSEVVKSAHSEGPQEITLRGQPAAVLLSIEDYARLTRAKHGLVDFLRQSPLHGADLQIERDHSPAREIAL
ncbi:MAG: type II toxin-antitoxin system Phd/YefM family antitoxin [Hydrogenophilaceae bacterium]